MNEHDPQRQSFDAAGRTQALAADGAWNALASKRLGEDTAAPVGQGSIWNQHTARPGVGHGAKGPGTKDGIASSWHIGSVQDSIMAEEYAQAMLNHVPDTPTTQSMLPDNLMGSPPESATTTAEPTSPWAGNAGPLPTDQSFMMQGWGDRPSGSRPSQSQASKTWNTAGVGGATGNWGLDMPNPLLSGAAGRGVADNGISPRLAEMVADLSNNPDALSVLSNLNDKDSQALLLQLLQQHNTQHQHQQQRHHHQQQQQQHPHTAAEHMLRQLLAQQAQHQQQQQQHPQHGLSPLKNLRASSNTLQGQLDPFSVSALGQLARGQTLTSLPNQHNNTGAGYGTNTLPVHAGHLSQLPSDILGMHFNGADVGNGQGLVDEYGWGAGADVAQLLALQSHVSNHHGLPSMQSGAHHNALHAHGDGYGHQHHHGVGGGVANGGAGHAAPPPAASRHAPLFTLQARPGGGGGGGGLAVRQSQSRSDGDALASSLASHSSFDPRATAPRRDQTKLSQRLVAAAANVGVTVSNVWAILRHPTFLDMLIKERELLRGVSNVPAVSVVPSSLQSTPVKGSDRSFASTVGFSPASTPRRGLAGAAGEPLDPAKRAEEMAKTQRIVSELMRQTATFFKGPQTQALVQALVPIAQLYDSMHELPVVQKRKRCAEMAALRDALVQQGNGLKETVHMLALLRHHLHAHTGRLLLLADSSSDGVPLDILLGCVCSELLGLLKACVAQDVLETFDSFLPHARLALLVFVEFTTVDPVMPKTDQAA